MSQSPYDAGVGGLRMSKMAPSQWVEVERLLAENARLLDQYQQAVNTNVFFLARAQEAEREVESLKEANRKLANQIHTGGEGLLREAVEAVDHDLSVRQPYRRSDESWSGLTEERAS